MRSSLVSRQSLTRYRLEEGYPFLVLTEVPGCESLVKLFREPILAQGYNGGILLE